MISVAPAGIGPVVYVVFRQDGPSGSISGHVYRAVVLRATIAVLNHDVTLGSIPPGKMHHTQGARSHRVDGFDSTTKNGLR